MLTKKDLQQIEDYGLDIEKVNWQLDTFKRGIPFVNIVTTATIGNGIEVIEKANQQKLVDLYDSKRNDLDIVKFVPASGAATRMFSFLYQFLETFDPEQDNLNTYLKKEEHNLLATFLSSIKDFAFINDVRKKIRKNHPEFKRCKKGMRAYLLVKTMLEENGLNYNNLPKGLIPFHKYSKYTTTAFEEHLFESAFYISSEDEALLHFTFAEKDLQHFKTEFEEVKKRVSKKTKTNFNISYSFQKRETDTIAVTEKNRPARNEKGELIFRPSGHGALIENLNEIDSDIIFIKNIDNVGTEEFVEEMAYYKKVLAGKLLWLQGKIFNYLRILLSEDYDSEIIKEVKSFLWNELNIKNIPESISEITGILNRPLRICGVVMNTGAPGGGPFWVKNEIGNTSLQIIEMVQVDLQDPRQYSVVNEATHFNPVDIVCGVRDYLGKKFDLSDFTDQDSGFISTKYESTIPVKALELPGLWNGAMANWNTAFVEVPLSTFKPVKIVNDLLKSEHRPLK